MHISIYKYSPRESFSSTLTTSNNNITSAAEAKLPLSEWCISIEAAISNYARLNNIDEADMSGGQPMLIYTVMWFFGSSHLIASAIVV